MVHSERSPKFCTHVVAVGAVNESVIRDLQVGVVFVLDFSVLQVGCVYVFVYFKNGNAGTFLV